MLKQADVNQQSAEINEEDTYFGSVLIGQNFSF